MHGKGHGCFCIVMHKLMNCRLRRKAVVDAQQGKCDNSDFVALNFFGCPALLSHGLLLLLAVVFVYTRGGVFAGLCVCCWSWRWCGSGAGSLSLCLVVLLLLLLLFLRGFLLKPHVV